MHRAAIISLLIILPQLAACQNVKLFGGLKTGGYAGRFALGGGCELTKVPLEASLWYGHTYHKATDININSLEIRCLWTPTIHTVKDSSLFSFNTGISGIYYRSPVAFASLPSRFPEGYYQPTAFQALLHLGLSYKFGIKIDNRTLPVKSSFLWSSYSSLLWMSIINRHPSVFESGTMSFSVIVYGSRRQN